MNNPLIEEVRAARAARAESLDYDPHKIAKWARNEHAERQKLLKSKKRDQATPGKPPDEVALRTSSTSTEA